MEAPTEACTRCQTPTTKRCDGCVGAPAADDSGSQATFYCSQECQKINWPQHKAVCRNLQARKRLARAASLLKGILNRITLHASQLQFKSARREGSAVYLEERQNPWRGPRLLRPFPICFEGDRSSREAAMAYKASVGSMMYLYTFIKELLASTNLGLDRVFLC